MCGQVMQNIGNLSTEMEAKKEPFMSQMSFLLPDSVQRLKEFILELVQIDQKNGEWPLMVARGSTHWLCSGYHLPRNRLQPAVMCV